MARTHSSANNRRQDRYSRRCDHAALRTVVRVPGERKPVIHDLGCPCGHPVTAHRRLGGPHTDPPGCTGYRPQSPSWWTFYTRARLRPHVVVYPPVVGWLRGRPNRWARQVLDRRAPYCDLDDAPWLLGRPTVGDADRAAW